MAFPQRLVPQSTVKRLPLYLRALHEMHAEGISDTSSGHLAELSGVTSVQLRKDLSHLGALGMRGVGYKVETLTQVITEALGLHQTHRLAIVGMGLLGSALAHYTGYTSRSFETVALFDVDPDKVGRKEGSLTVDHMDSMNQVIDRENVMVAIIATPASAAQDAADKLIEAGVKEILSFCPQLLSTPDDVTVRYIDVAGELQILAFHAATRQTQPTRATRRLAKSSKEGGQVCEPALAAPAPAHAPTQGPAPARRELADTGRRAQVNSAQKGE